MGQWDVSRHKMDGGVLARKRLLMKGRVDSVSKRVCETEEVCRCVCCTCSRAILAP